MVPRLVALGVFGSRLRGRSRELSAGQVGDDAAGAVGVRVNVTRLGVVLWAVTVMVNRRTGVAPSEPNREDFGGHGPMN